MTEQEWLACNDPVNMLRMVDGSLVDSGTQWTGHGSRAIRISNRRLRLFSCACVREVWDKLTDKRCRRAVEVAERYADGLADIKHDITKAQNDIDYAYVESNQDPVVLMASWVLRSACDGARRITNFSLIPSVAKARILGCIAGNRWKPIVCRVTGNRLGTDTVQVRRDGTLAGCDCAWLTPTVRSLAKAAYEERAGRKCVRCRGKGYWDEEDRGASYRADYYPRPFKRVHCVTCGGTGRVEDGSLDPVRLAILADALYEVGCADNREWLCMMQGKHSHDGRAGQVIHGVLHDFNPNIPHHHHDEKCHYRDVPHPLIVHLRSPGPHVMGCHAVDAILGKE